MILEVAEKAGINGLIAGVATAGYFGPKAQVIGLFGDSKMPLWLLMGAVGAIGSATGDGVHLLMKDVIPVSKKGNDRASVITSAVINGLLFGGALYCYEPKILEDFGIAQSFIFGAGSEFGGSALYTYLKENAYF